MKETKEGKWSKEEQRGKSSEGVKGAKRTEGDFTLGF